MSLGLLKGSPKGNKAQESLLNYIPDMPETTCLIFIESKIDKRLKLYKLLSKYGLVLEFTGLRARPCKMGNKRYGSSRKENKF